MSVKGNRSITNRRGKGFDITFVSSLSSSPKALSAQHLPGKPNRSEIRVGSWILVMMKIITKRTYRRGHVCFLGHERQPIMFKKFDGKR